MKTTVQHTQTEIAEALRYAFDPINAGYKLMLTQSGASATRISGMFASNNNISLIEMGTRIHLTLSEEDLLELTNEA